MEIRYSKESDKFLKKCDEVLEKRLHIKISQLMNDPYLGSKRLGGYDNKTYRIRVGNYRVIYEIDSINNIIFIVKISKRSKVYRIKDEDDYEFPKVG